MLAASFASHKKQERRRCFCQFSATEENQNSINQAEQQLTIIKKTFLNLLQKYKQIILTEYESVLLKMSRLKYISQNVSLIVSHF